MLYLVGSSHRARVVLIDQNHPSLTLTRQSQLLGIARTSLYTVPVISPDTLALMKALDRLHTHYPFLGTRKLYRMLQRDGYMIGRHRVRRLMTLMGIHVIYLKPNTSRNNAAHPIYPYLLSNLTLTHPNQVWSTDITYIPMPHGWLYLVAVIDWYSRRILSWRVSVTLDAASCISALEEAIRNYGTPEIFNTDQGVQFTSHDFINLLTEYHIKISMDGKGRWADNIFCERFWRTIKYEEIYLKEYLNPADAINHIRTYIIFYNTIRLHQNLDYHTPHELYTGMYHVTTAHQVRQ